MKLGSKGLTAALAGGAMLLIPYAVSSASAKEVGAKAFMKMVNTNADKTISRDELEAYAKKKFQQLQSDNDKTLDAKELRGRMSAAGMKKADSDSDKTVDESEFVGFADKLFDEANTKGDKTLTVKELKTSAGKRLRMLLH